MGSGQPGATASATRAEDQDEDAAIASLSPFRGTGDLMQRRQLQCNAPIAPPAARRTHMCCTAFLVYRMLKAAIAARQLRCEMKQHLHLNLKNLKF